MHYWAYVHTTHMRLSYMIKKCGRYRNDFTLGNYQNAAALNGV